MSIVDSTRSRPTALPPVDAPDPAEPQVARALDRGLDHLLGLQNADGHWRAELEGDSILESEYILTLCALGRLDTPRARKAGETLRRAQTPGGGWSTFPGGADDVNPTIKAYFALKLLGDDPEAAHMRAARDAAVALGGLDACNSFTKIYLAIFGQYPWARCPAVPPELVLLPAGVPFSIYQMSSWSRAIVVPLSIIRALRPRVEVAPERAVTELATAAPPRAAADSWRAAAWHRFFRAVDGWLRLYERRPAGWLRRRALAAARRWTLEHLDASDGLGAIFPPIVNSIFALRALGLPEDEPVVEEQVGQLERLAIEQPDTLKLQPCLSPVWDTALALAASLDAGLAPDSEQAARAASWLLDREVRRPGDWTRRFPGAPVGGWYFEYANEFYPDCDDTAQVVSTLSRVAPRDAEQAGRLAAALDRGVNWLVSMQNTNGGWGAFDRDCEREFLTHIPFADHNAMIDPATVDVTSRVVHALLTAGTPSQAPVVRRAVDFLLRSQEADGAWFGRWGCNYIYGTWLALSALRRAGEAPEALALRRGVAWLEMHQNTDGGWGELPLSYSDPSTRGCGPSTACQTAWALLGLLAGGAGDDRTLERGVDFLLRGQRDDGSWRDEHWTGTGFPAVFYLHYHGYATYFPLMALAAMRRRAAREAACNGTGD